MGGRFPSWGGKFPGSPTILEIEKTPESCGKRPFFFFFFPDFREREREREYAHAHPRPPAGAHTRMRAAALFPPAVVEIGNQSRSTPFFPVITRFSSFQRSSDRNWKPDPRARKRGTARPTRGYEHPHRHQEHPVPTPRARGHPLPGASRVRGTSAEARHRQRACRWITRPSSSPGIGDASPDRCRVQQARGHPRCRSWR